ncbi:MAG: Mrp/NBP35 family ATP-binding protein [Lachnospiraceae bacterium]|nr:Mrp/NBP35 family ATP-binding protein [Lachnospiraceae bacterium]
MADCNHDCGSCGESCGERTAPMDFSVPMNSSSDVKKVIGVVSGKGGVGKSLVTSLLAIEMRKKGLKTAILDGDLTGPSIPRIFGIHEKAAGNAFGILPSESAAGTKIMSVNLILDNETDAVIWRGPVVAGVVKQFWTDVQWGDVDVMLVDMPPGTGDVPLTVYQSLPIDGIVIVASPQELVGMIVSKAVNMANEMDIPVFGLVENMAYYECPDCGKRHEIFGKSHLAELAEKFSIELTAQIPIDPAMAEACDEGRLEAFENSYLSGMAEELAK